MRCCVDLLPGGACPQCGAGLSIPGRIDLREELCKLELQENTEMLAKQLRAARKQRESDIDESTLATEDDGEGDEEEEEDDSDGKYLFDLDADASEDESSGPEETEESQTHTGGKSRLPKAPATAVGRSGSQVKRRSLRKASDVAKLTAGKAEKAVKLTASLEGTTAPEPARSRKRERGSPGYRGKDDSVRQMHKKARKAEAGQKSLLAWMKPSN